MGKILFREVPVGKALASMIVLTIVSQVISLSDDDRILYFSDRNTASVTAMDLATGEVRVVYQESGIGPADIDVEGDTLYIPDMNSNRVITVTARQD